MTKFDYINNNDMDLKDCACISYEQATLGDKVDSSVIITSDYEVAKQFLQRQVEEQAEYEGITYELALDNLRVNKVNNLGKLFVCQFINESYGFNEDSLGLRTIIVAYKEFKRRVHSVPGYTMEDALLTVLTRDDREKFDLGNIGIPYLYLVAVACNKATPDPDILDNVEKIKTEAKKLATVAAALAAFYKIK
mgnify:CR=1 FL=1